jgi:hypothetical protein
MRPELERRFSHLERQKQALLEDLATWPAARLSFRPAPSAWSALEVLDHLCRVERGWTLAVRRNLADGPQVTVRDRVGALVVNAVMRSPRRVKVPAAATAVLPAGAHDLPALASRWADGRLQMHALLDGLVPGQCRKGVFKHPVAGWMPIPTALTFLSAHLRHHGYQLDRLRGSSSSIH